MLYKVETHS